MDNLRPSELKPLRRSTRSPYGGWVTPRDVVSLMRRYMKRFLRRGDLSEVLEGYIPVVTTHELRVEADTVSNDPGPAVGAIYMREGHVTAHNVGWLVIYVKGEKRYIPIYN